MKILISSCSFGIDESAIETVKKAGHTVVFNPHKRKLTEDEIIELLDEDVVGIIAGTEKISEKVLRKAKSLRVISRYGAGVDNIDLEAAARRGITVCSSSDAPTQAVAELTLALMLNLYRRISEVDRNIRSNEWNPLMGKLLSGKTLGIIGLGRIGKAVVKLVQPFHLAIMAQDPKPDNEFIFAYKIKLSSLKQVLSESDIISLHVPLTEETYHLIGSKEFALMKKDAIILNTARGSLIDEEALIEALEKGVISGAALDVFEEEPYYGKLRKFDNVILTPHIGSLTRETRIKMEHETVENLLNVLKGA